MLYYWNQYVNNIEQTNIYKVNGNWLSTNKFINSVKELHISLD